MFQFIDWNCCLQYNANYVGKRYLHFIAGFVTVFLTSCNGNYTPKPRGYFRIDLPEKEYKLFDAPECPFRFEIPEYSYVASYHDSLSQPCWKYIRFPQFNGEIFLSYRKIENNFQNLVEDSRMLAYKHAVKADAIDETFIGTPFNVSGIIYDIGGSAASSLQFFVTDSTQHFIRGALYFNAPPQPASLAPVIEFLRKDVIRLVKTMRWEGRDKVKLTANS